MGFDYQSLASGQFQMPDGWKLTTIEEVAKVNEKAITPKNAPPHIRYIDIASVYKGKLLDIQGLSFKEAPSRARRVVRDKDSLISTVRPNLEHYMFVKEPGPNTIASTGFAVVSAKAVDPRFLYYYMTSKPFTAYLIQIAESHTSAYPAFNPDVIEQAELLLPKDSDQRVIAHILGSLDDKIELNRRMNQTLEAMARAIFKSWFVDFDPVRAKAEGRPTGLPDDIAALFPDSFENSELGEIPKGWEVSTIGENAEKLSKGTTPRKNDVLNAQDTPSIPFLKVRNISDEGEIDLSKLDRIPRSIHEGFLKRSILKTNDVLFSIAGTIGRVSTLHEELNDSNANQAIAFVRPKKNELPSTFIRLILISDRIQYEASSRVVQGVQANVSLTVLSELKFAKPPQSIIDIWLRYFGDSFSRQELLLRESRSLSSLRDTLLPKLISGELRVPDAEKFIEEAGV